MRLPSGLGWVLLLSEKIQPFVIDLQWAGDGGIGWDTRPPPKYELASLDHPYLHMQSVLQGKWSRYAAVALTKRDQAN